MEATDKAIEVVEAWWQERRAAGGMDTETHNQEAARIEDLKKRIEAIDTSGIRDIDPEDEIKNLQEKREKK